MYLEWKSNGRVSIGMKVGKVLTYLRDAVM